jgi:hypothetical protein
MLVNYKWSNFGTQRCADRSTSLGLQRQKVRDTVPQRIGVARVADMVVTRKSNAGRVAFSERGEGGCRSATAFAVD